MSRAFCATHSLHPDCARSKSKGRVVVSVRLHAQGLRFAWAYPIGATRVCSWLTAWPPMACRYRHDLSKDSKDGKTRTVRSDFKEVYRLKVWVQSDDWTKRFKRTVEKEAKLMITIQSQVHHASHALLQEYMLPQDDVGDGGPGHKDAFFKMSHLEGYTLQQVALHANDILCPWSHVRLCRNHHSCAFSRGTFCFTDYEPRCTSFRPSEWVRSLTTSRLQRLPSTSSTASLKSTGTTLSTPTSMPAM